MSREKYRTPAAEAEAARALKAFQRLVPTRATESDPSAIRVLIQESLALRNDFKLSDRQLLSIMVERMDGSLKSKVSREMGRRIPLPTLIHDLQLDYPLSSRNKLEVQSRIANFDKTNLGIRQAMTSLLDLVRSYTIFYPDPRERERVEAQTFKDRILTLIPNAVGQEVQIELNRRRWWRTRKIRELILKYEKRIDDELKATRKKVGRMERQGDKFDDETGGEDTPMEKQRIKTQTRRLTQQNIRAEEERQELMDKIKTLKEEQAVVEKHREARKQREDQEQELEQLRIQEREMKGRRDQDQEGTKTESNHLQETILLANQIQANYGEPRGVAATQRCELGGQAGAHDCREQICEYCDYAGHDSQGCITRMVDARMQGMETAYASSNPHHNGGNPPFNGYGKP